MRANVMHGDCLDRLRLLESSSADSLVTDPPAGISFMGRAWDGDKGGRKQWIAYMAERFAECLRVLKPGAHGVVWALPRTSHWTATALEDAGFEIRDVVTHLFGSGFPKSLNVSKAIDKRRDDEPDVRKVCRWLRSHMEAASKTAAEVAEHFGVHSRMVDHWAARDTDSQPALPKLEQWDALRELLAFGGEMDAEVLRLNLRKGEPGEAWKERPVTGRVEEWADRTNFMITSRDGLSRDTAVSEIAKQWDGWGTALKPASEHWILVRKPLEGTVVANVLAHGTGALNIDGCRIAGAKPATTRGAGGQHGAISPLGAQGRIEDDGKGRWPANVVMDPEAGALLDEQSGPCKTGAGGTTKRNDNSPVYQGPASSQDRQTVGYADTQTGASRFFYCAKPSTAERGAGLYYRNDHETVKSVDLCRWLARLVTPPTGVVLDPFAGSGTVGIAATLEGFRYVGIEQQAEHAATARLRIEHWMRHGERSVDVAKTRAKQTHSALSGQTELFT